ncbi:MAG: YdcF family protein, partial [Rhodospirillales bacterium]|nr:YdcF family protein [Rhodospirillales bacterium]
SGSLTEQSLKEADYMAPILKQLGVNTQNVVLESQSRNTFENAVMSYDLANPAPDEAWILVTSARHMPRATGCFRKAGWANIIPYPVDFYYKGDETLSPPLSLTTGLSLASSALHEWLGLFMYSITNKTSTFLPAP